MSSGVADRALAFGVGPAGAVGDQLAVVEREQVGDDLSEQVQVGVAGFDQSGSDVVREREVAARGLGSTGARLCPALLVLGGGVAELVVVEAGAGEVRLRARRCRVVGVDVLARGVEHLLASSRFPSRLGHSIPAGSRVSPCCPR